MRSVVEIENVCAEKNESLFSWLLAKGQYLPLPHAPARRAAVKGCAQGSQSSLGRLPGKEEAWPTCQSNAQSATRATRALRSAPRPQESMLTLASLIKQSIDSFLYSTYGRPSQSGCIALALSLPPTSLGSTPASPPAACEPTYTFIPHPMALTRTCNLPHRSRVTGLE